MYYDIQFYVVCFLSESSNEAPMKTNMKRKVLVK